VGIPVEVCDRNSNPHLAITCITHWSSKYVSDVTFSLVIHMWQEGNPSLSCKWLEEACLLFMHCFFVFVSFTFVKHSRPKHHSKKFKLLFQAQQQAIKRLTVVQITS